MKVTPLLFLDAIAILLVLIFAALLKGGSTGIPTSVIIYAACIFIVIRLLIAGLVRVANSVLSDALKLCWVLLILLLPILGSIACLIVVDKRRI